MQDNKHNAGVETKHEEVYGKQAVRLMLAQPLNMFNKLELQVLHKGNSNSNNNNVISRHEPQLP